MAAGEAKRDRARSFEDEAARNVGLVRIHWLKEAIAVYREVGDKEALDRLAPLYAAAGIEAQAELHVVSGTTEIRREDIEQVADQMTIAKGPTLAGYLRMPRELGLWTSRDALRRNRTESDVGGIHQLFGSHIFLEADGRIQPEPDVDKTQDLEDARDATYFGRQSTFLAAFASVLLTELRHRNLWSAPLVATSLAVVDPDLSESCYPGLIRFEQEDFWSAAHVIVPQIERALRVLGRLVGADQTRFTPAAGIRWASMELVLEDPGIRAALGEDVAYEIAVLFTDPHGQNFRNNIAHGALATDGNPHAAALLGVFTIFEICRAIVIATRQPHQAAP